MKVHELLRLLESQPRDRDVFILDGFNGGGHPREINFKCLYEITQEDIDESADVEDFCEGHQYIALGYGSY